METYLIEPKVSTVNFLPVFRGFEWETGACALFLRAPQEGIARLAFVLAQLLQECTCPYQYDRPDG
jgi:hypothetical protein